MPKKVQAKDITDQEILDAVRARTVGGPLLDLAFPQYPVKVVMAKVESMIRRGILDCGVSWRTAYEVKRRAAGQPL